MPFNESVHDKRIARWNRLYRGCLLILVLAIIGVQLQANNRSSMATQEARRANIARQESIQNYLKCLSILRFDVPPEQLQTRDGVIKALDTCAAKE